MNFINMKKIMISLGLVIIWMGIIFLFSSMNDEESNNKSKYIIGKIIGEVSVNTNDDNQKEDKEETIADKFNFLFRKISHATVYLILSFFVCNFFYQINKRKFKNNYLISVFICLLYAISDEYHQTFVGRNGNYQDVLIDGLGAIVGCLMFYWIVKMIKNSKKKLVNCS